MSQEDYGGDFFKEVNLKPSRINDLLTIHMISRLVLVITDLGVVVRKKSS